MRTHRKVPLIACGFGERGPRNGSRGGDVCREYSASTTGNALAHSLSEHAARTIESTAIILSNVVYRFGQGDTPQAEHLNQLLAVYTHELPQLREVVVLDENGKWKFSSVGKEQSYNNSDRDYFRYHKSHADQDLR